MRNSTRRIVTYGWIYAASLCAAACAPKHPSSMTVADLMEDRVTLDGVLLKCNQNPSRARDESDCMNARIAVERLAKDVDPTEEAKRNAQFERRREQLRLAEEKSRRDREAKTRVDGYDLPVVPMEPAPAAASAVPNHP